MNKGTIFFNGIDYSNGGGDSSNGINYSTEEQVIGAWIDGKPLYQKTIQCVLNFPYAWIGAIVQHNISNFDIGVNAFGFVKRDNDVILIPSMRSDTNGQTTNAISIYNINKTEFNINTLNKADLNGKTAYITLQYTKTTD